MKSEKETMVCPKCGAVDLRWLLGGKLGDQYRCPKCGYEGIALKGNQNFVKALKEGD